MIWNRRSARRIAARLLLTQRCQQACARDRASPGAKPMKFASTRLVAADMKSMVAFYEMVTGQQAEWLAPVFAEIVTSGATLAIGAAETTSLFSPGIAEPKANRTATLEFRVADVDAEYARLKDKVSMLFEPKTMPWGNRTTQFRDPEGTIVSLF